jgi:hypothetical protein
MYEIWSENSDNIHYFRYKIIKLYYNIVDEIFFCYFCLHIFGLSQIKLLVRVCVAYLKSIKSIKNFKTGPGGLVRVL